MRKIVPAFVAFVALASWACHDKIVVYPPPRVQATPPPQGGTIPATPTIIYRYPKVPAPPPTVPVPDILKSANANFGQGKYRQAIKEYETYLKDYPQAPSQDGIYFNIGMSYALASKSDRNLAGAKLPLKRLLKEFPDSPYKSQAELILDLIAQVELLNQDVQTGEGKIKQLEEELNRLKEIDLKRRPSRPTKQ
jgi:hypothetical protein